MGTVFKARQLSMNRLVAIKVLHPKLAANAAFLGVSRARPTWPPGSAATTSSRPSTSAPAGDIHYFVMEYVEGTTIKAELEKGKIYDEKEAVEIVLQIAQALEHAQRRQLIHRDVKPANIMLTPEGIAKLADLGMARHVADEALAGEERPRRSARPTTSPPRTSAAARTSIAGPTCIRSGRPCITWSPARSFASHRVPAILHGHLMKELTPPDHLNTRLSAGLGEVVEYA